MQKMSEEIALYCLKADSESYSEVCEECSLYGDVGCDHCYNDAINTVIKALEEISQYKQGGIVLIPADVYQRQCDELDAYKTIADEDVNVETRQILTDLAFDEEKIKDFKEVKALQKAVIALKEIQQYRAIGTVDECREAVERMKPKKVKKIQIPNTSWSKACIRFECPSCNKYLNYMELSHCGLCGRAIDWSE